MVRSVVFALTLLFSIPVVADNAGEWAQEWWQSYDQQEQREQIIKQQDARCPEKLEFYGDKVKERPKNIWYRHQMDKWTRRCAE